MSATSEAVQKLSRDLRAAAQLMGVREARYFVNTYYDLQDYRIASANQQRKLLEGQEPSEFMGWLNGNLQTLENQIKAMLDKWSAAQPMGIWAREIVGIGPVIASGLLAHIDIAKAPTAGHIWRFAGLDPTVEWKKGEKRPWNASLKRLCWLMGESFVKVSGNPKDIYGKLYLERKAYEARRNERGELADFARRRLAEDKNQKLDPELRAIFERGQLPQIALHERAKRWAVKQFLGDWHGEAYRRHYGTEPPLPYPIAHLGHVHQRAVIGESTESKERAVQHERTGEEERAIAVESTESKERAGSQERTAPSERAGHSERTGHSERAVQRESTEKSERAVTSERTELAERAVQTRENRGNGA